MYVYTGVMNMCLYYVVVLDAQYRVHDNRTRMNRILRAFVVGVYCIQSA